MPSFSVDMRKYAASKAENLHELTRVVVMGVMSGVTARSPVGNRELWADNIDRAKRGLPPAPKGYIGGRFRANWQLGVGEIPKGVMFDVSPPASSYPTGEQTVRVNSKGIPRQAGGRMYYIANNLPYAQALEDGHSTQSPPGGMVKLTVMEFNQYIKAALAMVRK